MKKHDKTDPEVDLKTEYEQKIAELTAQLQRTAADYSNLKRQAEQEIQTISRRAKTDLILDILPILDNFQLAAKHVPAELENNVWAEGIKQIEKQFEMILEKTGLEKIPSIGEPFDHNLHEALSSIVCDKPEDEVIEEIQAGYKLGGNIIRPAKVVVSCGVKGK